MKHLRDKTKPNKLQFIACSIKRRKFQVDQIKAYAKTNNLSKIRPAGRGSMRSNGNDFRCRSLVMTRMREDTPHAALAYVSHSNISRRSHPVKDF